MAAKEACSLFAVLLTQGAGEILITRLVSQGLTVGPLIKDKSPFVQRDACTTALLRIEGLIPDPKQSTAKTLINTARTALDGYGWFFLLAIYGESVAWDHSNIEMPRHNALERIALED